MRIYFAGPLFTTAEREWNVRMARALEAAGYEVWLPQENEPRDKNARDIFLMDVEGLKWTDVVVANMDGTDPDSGTCWECGWAYAMNKPVLLIRTDFRTSSDTSFAPYNLMLSESCTTRIEVPFGSTEQVIERLLGELRGLVKYHGAA
jgi:nucleoside 2-deoxyribosyltransferase